MKTTTFTSTISPQLNSWLAEYSKEIGQTRRAVLEDALSQYRADTIRASLRADFARASVDSEFLDMTEWGMDDYAAMVSNNE